MRWFVMMALGLVMNAAVAEQKIAVVDVQRAILLSDAAKVSAEKLEKEHAEDLKKINALGEQLRQLQEKREKNADFMSEEESKKLAKEFADKNTEYQFYGKKLKKLELQNREELFQTLFPKAEKLLKEIIDEGEYDLVLQAGAAVYTTPQTNLTKPLLERLNADK